MNRIRAGALALKGFLVVAMTAINFVTGILDTVADVAQAVAKPEHKTLYDRNVDAKSKLGK